MRSIVRPWAEKVLVGSSVVLAAACGGDSADEGVADPDATGVDAADGGTDGGVEPDPDAGPNPDAGPDADGDASNPDTPDGTTDGQDGDTVDPGVLDTVFTREVRALYGAEVTFEFACTQPPCTFECTVVGRPVEPGCTSPWSPAGLPEGASSILIRATNAAGVSDETPASHAFVVDRTPPQTLSTSEVPFIVGPLTESPLDITCEDSSATRLECQVDNEPWDTCTSPVLLRRGTGSYILRVRCVDEAGNIDSSDLEWAYTWDETPPVLTFMRTPPARVAVGSDSEFNVQCADIQQCDLECTLDGSVLESCAFPLALPDLDVGEHTLRVTATDQAGNRATTDITHTWNVERGWRDIALGDGSACGITTDGELLCWGDLTRVRPELDLSDPVFMGVSDALRVSISVDSDAVCVVTESGSVLCRGANDRGQLGRGNTASGELNWAPALNVADAVQVEMGRRHACALTSDGSVWCWGDNQSGQVGADAETLLATTPLQLALSGSATELAVGEDFACALMTTGVIECWGLNSDGQLGRSIERQSEPPGPVGGTNVWESVQAGRRHACAVDTLGHGWCWGSNSNGQLGVGNDDSDAISRPVEVVPEPVHALATWGETTCMVQDGSFECAGSVDILGLPGVFTSYGFVTGRPSAAVHLELGSDSACGFDANGFVSCWGELWSEMFPSEQYFTPAESLDAGWSALEVARDSGPLACGIRSGDSSLWCWGTSGSGATFAREGAVRATVPQLVLSGLAWRDVAVQGTAICGVADFGGVLCWGNNSGGLLGSTEVSGDSFTPVSPSLPGSNWVEIEASASSFCARRATGEVWCWGRNFGGEAGTGDQQSVLTPRQVGSATDWTRLSMSGLRTCGLRQPDGALPSLWCWGFQGAVNDLAPVQIGEPRTFTAIAAGQFGDFALTTDGRLLAAGRVVAPPDPRPALVEVFPIWNWRAIDAPGPEQCLVTNFGSVYCWGNTDMTGLLGPGFESGSATPTLAPVGVGTVYEMLSVRVGREFACSLDDEGGRWCWGVQRDAVLGNGFDPWEPAEFPALAAD